MAKDLAHFNVYDKNGLLRTLIDRACQQQDMSRSQLVRHAVREYLCKRKLA